jgi:excisionase family DNA binding protein
MQFTIPTTDEIRSAIRDELAVFFSSYQIQPQPETDEIGGVEMAMQITGKAKPTIYDLVHKRQIPHSKRGKQLYFSRRELLEWIRSGRRKTATEIKSAAQSI